jgi:hypothetical protein
MLNLKADPSILFRPSELGLVSEEVSTFAGICEPPPDEIEREHRSRKHMPRGKQQ